MAILPDWPLWLCWWKAGSSRLNVAWAKRHSVPIEVMAMAGFSKLYCIGGLGGFQGVDGINPISLQIWVGEGNRQWLEPHCLDSSIRPLGSVRTIVPEGPDDPSALIDACIAFFPKHFRQCPSFAVVERQLQTATRLDFDLGKDDIPKEWAQLRREAWPFFKKLTIFEAVLSPLQTGEEGAS